MLSLKSFSNLSAIVAVAIPVGLGICPIALALVTPTAVVAETTQQQAERHNVRGGELFQANNARGAIAEFDRAIALEPTNAQFYFNRGYVKHKGLEDYSGALKDLDRAIQLNPSFMEAYAVRAYVKTKLNDYRGAVTDYDRVIVANPGAAAMWQERGIVKYANLKDLPGALRDFDKAIELEPNNVMSYVFRGLVRRDLGQREGAIADFRKGLALARAQNDDSSVSLTRDALRNMGVNE
jgi:tetratricopeptide (TPR) repeat protein